MTTAASAADITALKTFAEFYPFLLREHGNRTAAASI